MERIKGKLAGYKEEKEALNEDKDVLEDKKKNLTDEMDSVKDYKRKLENTIEEVSIET